MASKAYKCIRDCYFRDRYFQKGKTYILEGIPSELPRHFELLTMATGVPAAAGGGQQPPADGGDSKTLKQLADEDAARELAERRRLGLEEDKQTGKKKRG